MRRLTRLVLVAATAAIAVLGGACEGPGSDPTPGQESDSNGDDGGY